MLSKECLGVNFFTCILINSSFVLLKLKRDNKVFGHKLSDLFNGATAVFQMSIGRMTNQLKKSKGRSQGLDGT